MGTLPAEMTEEQRLRARLLDVERERDEWKADAMNYRAWWEAIRNDCDRLVAEVGELKAALARVGLRMSP